MVSHSPSLAVLFLATLAPAAVSAQPATFEFSFWPGPFAKQDRRVLRIQDHPCGQVAIARVSLLPGLEQAGALIAEKVLEVNAADQSLRHWRVPVDSRPLAFRGDQLIFENGTLIFRVDRRGRVSRYPGSKPAPAPSIENCDGGSAFPNSSYAVCQILTDLLTGQPRRVRFEAPCT